MRIAIVDLVFHWPPRGGSMVDVREVAIRLKAMGNDVKIFSPYFPGFYPRGKITADPGVAVEHIPFNRFTFNCISVPKRFRKAIDSFHPDKVFLTDGYFLKPYIASELAHYSIVWRAYSYEIFCPKNDLFDFRVNKICDNSILKNQTACVNCFKYHKKFRKSWIKMCLPFSYPELFLFQEFWMSRADRPQFRERLHNALKSCETIIVYNQLQAEFFRQFNQNIVIAPTGIPDNFAPVNTSRSNPNKKVILMSGRIGDPVKGYRFLLEACRLLWNDDIDLELWITAVKNPIEGIYPFVKNLGWFKPHQLPEIISQSDIVCVPSIWEEAFGIVAIEAMACKRPVIATRVGGLQHSVVDGETGFLVKPQNPCVLADKIKFLLDRPELCEKMGIAGKMRVDNRFRWSTVIDKIYRPIFS